jgi:hypothetical protein
MRAKPDGWQGASSRGARSSTRDESLVIGLAGEFAFGSSGKANITILILPHRRAAFSLANPFAPT